MPESTRAGELEQPVQLRPGIAAKTLLLSIMRALALPEKELLPDPSARVNAYITHRRD